MYSLRQYYTVAASSSSRIMITHIVLRVLLHRLNNVNGIFSVVLTYLIAQIIHHMAYTHVPNAL